MIRTYEDVQYELENDIVLFCSLKQQELNTLFDDPVIINGAFARVKQYFDVMESAPPLLKELFVYIYIEHLDITETADALQLSPSSVRRTRKLLIDYLCDALNALAS
ncbi:MAG: hypothetical protein IJ309_01450 [Clostridia bacterium]|nr:hypothetical protein [Clostridia bacterium]